MPSITTHYIFAKEVFNNLKTEDKKRIESNIDIYQTFAQSHDYLFYYKFGTKHKEINKLGRYAHHNNTQEYLLNIVKEIKNNKEEQNSELLAYLYGSITHYVLDTTCHPYIFYKTGVYRKKEPNTKKYFGGHSKIEKDLDAYYYKKYTKKDYNLCNISKEIIDKPVFSNKLINTINKVYKETYNKENIGNYYIKAINNTKFIYSLIINDRFGIKKAIYKLLDFILNNNKTYISTYSTYIKKPDIKYLNKDKKEWNNPCNPELKYNYSFDELYEIALNKTIEIIKEINKVLDEDKPVENLTKYILDLDYSSGLEIKNTRQLRYFEN